MSAKRLLVMTPTVYFCGRLDYAYEGQAGTPIRLIDAEIVYETGEFPSCLVSGKWKYAEKIGKVEVAWQSIVATLEVGDK